MKERLVTGSDQRDGQQGEHSHEGHEHGHEQEEQGEHSHEEEEHGHEHDHGEHGHVHAEGWLGKVQEAIPFLHGHSHGEANVDTALESNARGIWALKISLLALGATALFQVVIAIISGSTGLLADTIHNFSDAFTAVPLWIAFSLAKRAANRRYTYGYGRAEDVAGVISVLMIFASALLSGYESIVKLLHPQPLQNVWWVLVAAIVGFLGNEGVALFRIRIGREIGSAALVADGQHARIDGLTSLAVLLGVFGSLLGFPLVDPIVGLLISIAILFIVKDTASVMWGRLMDAVDPAIVDSIEQAAAQVPGVQGVSETRVRWHGHTLQAELEILVEEDISIRQSQQITEAIRHELLHVQPRLTGMIIEPIPASGNSYAVLPVPALQHEHTPLVASTGV